MVSGGPFIVVWQAMQARPGFISDEPWSPRVQFIPLVQVGATANGSGAPPPPFAAPASTAPPSVEPPVAACVDSPTPPQPAARADASRPTIHLILVSAATLPRRYP